MLSNQSNIGLVSVNENHKKQHPRFGKQDDGIVPNLSEPSFEYDDMWESFETTDLESNGKHQIIMRELSFGEEEKKLELKDLLAPVFLAVAHDDEVVLNREKRTVSIADFCSLAMKDEESKHGEQKLNSSHRLWYSQPALNESLNLKSFMQSTNSALSSVSSCSTVNKHTSVGSDFYNESIDDSLEDEALMNVFVNNNMFDGEAQNVGDDKKFENDIFTDKEFCTSSLKEFELQVPGSPILYDLMSDSSCDGTHTPQFSDTSTSLSFARINTSPTTDPISNRKSRRFSKYIVVTVCGEKRIVDTSLMGNHLKLLSHGGYRLVGDSEVVILVFNAAYLPIVGQPKYQIILEQLFYYCVHAIELLVREKYEIVLFNSQMKSGSIPPVDFVKKCYETVNYRLKKNLQNVYFVHQNTWLKVLLKISQLFARCVCVIYSIKIFCQVCFCFINTKLDNLIFPKCALFSLLDHVINLINLIGLELNLMWDIAVCIYAVIISHIPPFVYFLTFVVTPPFKSLVFESFPLIIPIYPSESRPICSSYPSFSLNFSPLRFDF